MSNVTKPRLAIALLAALVTAVVVAFVASFLYPITVGGLGWDYGAAAMRGDSDAWQVEFAVFVVSAVVTVLFTVPILAFFIGPLIYFVERFRTALTPVYFCAGIGISLLVMGVWVALDGVTYELSDSDLHFALIVIGIDGPLGMMALRWALHRKTA